jgi:hypothetical protein
MTNFSNGMRASRRIISPLFRLAALEPPFRFRPNCGLSANRPNYAPPICRVDTPKVVIRSDRSWRQLSGNTDPSAIKRQLLEPAACSGGGAGAHTGASGGRLPDRPGERWGPMLPVAVMPLYHEGSIQFVGLPAKSRYLDLTLFRPIHTPQSYRL